MKNHPHVWTKMWTHLSSTYTPKTELEASMTITHSIPIKCWELEKQVTRTNSTIIDVNKLAIYGL